MSSSVKTDLNSQMTALQVVVSALAMSAKADPEFAATVERIRQAMPETPDDPGNVKFNLSMKRLLGG
ncbi:hypothetical protein [Stenotrophomonas maltophilia]|uniref:hypothetical protein n=1 Tax=Stenotrophomonas maltophilia TaxID=40324 RepID=UPI0021DA6228|nr:hypothetical protein [Stenotrophomonas maltophilia]UXY46991.1 hypothetical protein N8888_11415 [Stenotrophomonas maltophilia]